MTERTEQPMPGWILRAMPDGGICVMAPDGDGAIAHPDGRRQEATLWRLARDLLRHGIQADIGNGAHYGRVPDDDLVLAFRSIERGINIALRDYNLDTLGDSHSNLLDARDSLRSIFRALRGRTENPNDVHIPPERLHQGLPSPMEPPLQPAETTGGA
ncbi:hypothetical protein [Thioalkalivibrio sp. ALJ8]|uniref:hypothetical protein n=1 Tax=Thioalkalivibrio sp. ALJ8 TaxID=1158757 RepID=UPI0012DF2CE7|nr:hypothetical protein [Thioalkalivibrio sp. ALJ8]